MNSQYKKGFLRLAVLTYLTSKEQYGYELVKDIGEQFNAPAGTIYPLLYKLVEDEMVETYLSDDSGGGIRKYYKLNEKGLKEQRIMIKEWEEFNKTTTNFLKQFKK